MSETEYVAATESPTRHWRDEQDGVRVFRMSDQLIANALLDWSPPVQMKIEKRDDGTYELICRRVD